jgi:tetratricopeptide (TPR) repeat protein
MLRHLPFFEVLGDTQEGSPDWRSISAGLLVLRLFDSWVDYGHEIVTTDMTGLRAIREAIDAIDEVNPVRELLRGVIDTMYDAETVDIKGVTPKLMAYARALDHSGKWSLAADVLRTVLAALDPHDDADMAIAANMHLGYVCRTQSLWEDAEEAYKTAEKIAARTNDLASVLRAHIGKANLVSAKGNLPQAEKLFEGIIDKATTAGLAEVRGTAFQDRAVVAFHRGEYERAVLYSFEALAATKVPAHRDRVLFDIAASFIALGNWETARDANLILASAGQEQMVRWAAMVNLMEIASHEGFEIAFDQYRRELEAASLPPYTMALYRLSLGQCLHRLGRLDEADTALRAAIDLSTANRFNQIVFQSEKDLVDVITGTKAARIAGREVSTVLGEVATAIKGMREEAGV